MLSRFLYQCPFSSSSFFFKFEYSLYFLQVQCSYSNSLFSCTAFFSAYLCFKCQTFHFCTLISLLPPFSLRALCILMWSPILFHVRYYLYTFFFFFCKATLFTTSFFLRKCSNLLYLSYEVLAAPTLLPQT